MKAGAVVDLMQQRLGGQLNRTRLLGEIRHAQNEILCLPDVPVLRVRGNVYLPTVAEQVVYASLPYRTVTRVFERSTAPQRGSGYGTGFHRPVQIGRSECEELDYTFECVESNAPGETCTVRFPDEFNPGDTTSTFLLEAYTWPTQPTSEESPMSMPDHWITTLLYYAIKKRVEESQYGVDIYNAPQFQDLMGYYLTKTANAPQAVIPKRPMRF